MTNFKDLGVNTPSPSLKGDKIETRDVLDTEVTVCDYSIVDSKFTDKGNGKCLRLQLKVEDKDRVLFTGSGVLMDMVEQIPKNKLPFTTKIIKRNRRFEFT